MDITLQIIAILGSLIGVLASFIIILRFLINPIREQVYNHIPTQIKEIKEHQKELKRLEIKKLEQKFDQKFDQVNQKFDQVNQKFDQKFDQVNQDGLTKSINASIRYLIYYSVNIPGLKGKNRV